jgi:hypothetical protein
MPRNLNASDEQPQTPINVARRALILSGVVCRASLESCPDKTLREGTLQRVNEGFDRLELWPHLEPTEERIIRANYGTMDKRLAIRGQWFVEGLAILGWALGLGEFPRHDQTVDPFEVTGNLGFLDPSAEDLLKSPKLRPLRELKAAREWYYDAHCTIRGFLNHGGDGHLAEWIDDFPAILDVKPQSVMVDRILAVDGRPLHEISRGRVQECEWVIGERHRGTIWLVGEYPSFTELPVDTWKMQVMPSPARLAIA